MAGLTVSSRDRRPGRRWGGAMAELKTKPTDVAVRDHLAEIRRRCPAAEA
jgi:hypothetical protein